MWRSVLALRPLPWVEIAVWVLSECCVFPLSFPTVIDPIPNVVELWQAEEGDLLMPAQVRKPGGGSVGAGVLAVTLKSEKLPRSEGC